LQSRNSNRASDRHPGEALSEGRVVAAFGQRLVVEDVSGGRHPAFVGRRGLRVVCGDRVRWRPSEDHGDVAVVDLLPRDSELTRPDSRGRVEVLAANIDQVVVVCAPEPLPDPFIIDRYLAAAEVMGAAALVACNKIDLPGADALAVLDEFRAVGYPVLRVSALAEDGLDALHASLADHCSILVGQSGVGKSSLLNVLIPGIEAATAQVSAATGEGRHRTTATRLYTLPCGGALLDAPGVRDFAPALADPRLAVIGFREIIAAAERCRFANCRHMREPRCAVKDGVEAGTISPRRYESYRRLLRLTEDLRGHA
jgi:ribosome biogenesis GTPase / thiamine phosphate phosphatase